MYGDDSPTASGPSGTTNQFGSQAEKAWDAGFTGSKSVIVGVVDEGIDINHADLKDNIWVNPFDTADDGIDNDGNGYVDDVNGWDFVNNDNTVYDGSGDDHGTTVAGRNGDYTSASGTLTFNPGETSKVVSVAVTNDSAVEADERFFVDLSRASGATISVARGTGAIVNDDVAPATVSRLPLAAAFAALQNSQAPVKSTRRP
jgi:hypothetical protein